MIERIGVIYQDGNSLGFLRGLRTRLRCNAELIDPPAAIGKSRQLTRRQASLAWRYFTKKGAHLVVRFTDADEHRWQDVQRRELEVFPQEARSLIVCGVAVENTEDWLCLDLHALSSVFDIASTEVTDGRQRADRIKNALRRKRGDDDRTSDVVERFVRELPETSFRKWLENPALRRFYCDCRAAAAAANCETPNELNA